MVGVGVIVGFVVGVTVAEASAEGDVELSVTGEAEAVVKLGIVMIWSTVMLFSLVI